MTIPSKMQRINLALIFIFYAKMFINITYNVPAMNRVKRLLGTKYPVIQGPMMSITLGDFAAEVSKSGALGVIASAGLTPQKLREEIEKVKSVGKPFAVNIPIYQSESDRNLEVALDTGVEIIYTSAGV